MMQHIVNTLAWRLKVSPPPVIRHLVIPSHCHEGELVRNKMTRKLEQDRSNEEVRRAVNAWLYEGSNLPI